MISTSKQWAVGSGQRDERPNAIGVFAKVSSDLRYPPPLSLGEGRGEGASAFDRLPTAHCPLPTRLGISLLEVLIAIFIVAVGLVSIASLLPIGSIQLEKAGIEERKATLGINVLRDFQTRGFGNPSNWVGYNDIASPSPPWIPYKAAFGTVDQSKFLPSASVPNSFLPTIVIDPLMVSVGYQSGTDTTVQLFPANYAVTPSQRLGPIVRRLTVNSAFFEANSPPSASDKAFTRSLADALCTLGDDIVTSQPDTQTDPGTGLMTQAVSSSSSSSSSSSPPLVDMKRSYEGLYTWLATLAPNAPFPDAGSISVFGNTTTTTNQYMLSIVVFYRRMLSTPVPATDQQGQEEMVGRFAKQWVDVNDLTNANGQQQTATGGGEFLLNDSSANASAKLAMVKPGQWIMLCRYRPAFVDQSAATPAYFPWVEAKWYRIVAAGDIVTPASPLTGLQMQVTLAGEDWDSTPSPRPVPYYPPSPTATDMFWPPTTSVPTATLQRYYTYACLFDGAVGVYQRIIHLDGQSVWSQ